MGNLEVEAAEFIPILSGRRHLPRQLTRKLAASEMPHGEVNLPIRQSVPAAPAGLPAKGKDQTEAEVENMPEEPEKTRREFLEEAVRQDPHNTFARYGLALELANTEPDAAWTHFEYLLLNHPEYSATYAQAGAFLTKQGRIDEARRILATGVEVTGRQRKRHAQTELQAALDDLGNQ